MCGIAGVVNLDSEPVSQRVLKRMTDAMAHRGPDGEGRWVKGAVGLGHRRLAIIDLSPAGAQPMSNEDGDVLITYNGEVYNFLTIRPQLTACGHRFQSNTDTEVVLHAYEEWGVDCVRFLNGMFAFGIWDQKNRRVFLARDRYGIKPLYYWHSPTRLVFASEIKALLEHPDIQCHVDEAALLEYFTFQNVFTDRTLFRGIKLLPPGHRVVVDLDTATVSIDRYWDFAFQEPDRCGDEREYLEELDRLFVQAVRRQLVSDVPVGTYLSGGMDSGAITCVAAQDEPGMCTFTCGFDLTSASGLELTFDERVRAEALSYHFGTEHYEVVLKAGDMERVFPSLVYHLEDLRVGQSYPNFYVARLASKFVKVVLGGTGGDELFAGYPWRYYRTVHSLDLNHYVENYYKFWHRLVPNRVIHRLFHEDLWKRIQSIRTIDIFRDVIAGGVPQKPTPEGYIKQSLYFECKTFLPGLLLVKDKLGMAHGLESRLPFLDNDLVDFAVRVPVKLVLRDLEEIVRIDENDFRDKQILFFEKTNDGKLLLRKMLQKYLPIDYTTGVKQGFSAPDASWFRGESMRYVRAIPMDPRSRIYQYMRPDTVQELVTEHLSGKQNRRLLIWSLLSFEQWLRNFDPLS